jgi:plastocyanin domain-containing protein
LKEPLSVLCDFCSGIKGLQIMIIRLVSTVFVIFVALSCSTAFAQAGKKPRKDQRVTINLTGRGYEPSSFRLEKGVRARLIFIRKTEYECGREVVFPAYNIRRELPLNTPVTIRFTPRKTGTFSFTCGMNMLHGKLIVR